MEKAKQDQIEDTRPRLSRPFEDFSKTEEGEAIFEANSKLWKDGDFAKHVRSLKDPKEIELAQIIRKYQSSFVWIKPSAKPEDLVADFDLGEGYLRLEVIIPEKYSEEPASYVLLNHTIPKVWRRNFEKELFELNVANKSIFKTLRAMDNNLDRIFDRLYGVTEEPQPPQKVEQQEAQPQKQQQPQQQPQPQAKKRKQSQDQEQQSKQGQQKQQQPPQQQEKISKATEKNSKPVEKPKPAEMDPKLKQIMETHDPEKWSQELQSLLEKAIVTHKDVKDPKEKWTLIAKDVPGKTMEECVERFKYCKQKALEKKIQEEEEKKEDASDEEYKEGDSEEESSSEDEEAAKNLNDTVKVNCTLNYKLNVLQLTTKNVAIANLTKVQVQVACKSCKAINQLTAERVPHTDYLVSNQQCTKCKSPSNIFFRIGYIHRQNNVAALFGSLYWDIRDVHFCQWSVTCEFCDTANESDLILSGTMIDRDCFGCYKKIMLTYMAMTISANVVDDGEADPDDYLGEDSLAKKQGGTQKVLKVGKFKLDEPLPRKGTCKHAKNSFRYFRFPCCGKAYPCDGCHDAEEKHEMILAKSMICGFCSMEQPVSEFCKRCTKMVSKTSKKTGYWEGGQGNRNKATMARHDKRKYAGLSKTESRRAQEKKHK